MSERCRIYLNFWKLYRWGIARLMVLDLIFSYYVWKEREIHELRELYKSAAGWIAHYPERQKFRIHVGKGVVYIWLSFATDEPKTFPV